MPIEVEQKFKITDVEAVLGKMQQLGAASKHIVRQVDTYFGHPTRNFGETDEALRIRRVGESNFVTYKGPKLDPTTKTRREIELPFASGEVASKDLGNLLETLDFRRVADVAKIRQIFHLQRDKYSVEIALDQVEKLGDFIELEIVVDTDEEIEAATSQLAELAEALELAESERRSYLELLIDD